MAGLALVFVRDCGHFSVSGNGQAAGDIYFHFSNAAIVPSILSTLEHISWSCLSVQMVDIFFRCLRVFSC